MNIAITCIIPTCNRPEVICETIKQLLNQTLPAHEIIIIDQTRSYPSHVLACMQEWAASGCIKWYCQSAANASMARNSGALLARGDVLLFLDDDIRIRTDFLAAHASNYEGQSMQGVAGQILDGDGSTVNVLTKQHKDIEWGSLNFPKNYDSRIQTAWMASGNFSVPKEIYLELGGMDEWYEKGAYREESDFAMRYFRSGRMFQFDPSASLYHLGKQVVSGGGCRSFTSVWGGWHHFVGSWYFTLGFAKPSNVIQMVWAHWRSLAFNAASLRKPLLFVARACMFLMAFPFAASLRFRGAKLVNR